MSDRREPYPIEDIYQGLIASLQDCAVLILDPKGNIAAWNERAQHITGWEEHEVVGRHVSILYPEELRDNDGIEREFETARTEGKAELEVAHMRKDGTKFTATNVLTPLFHKDGGLYGFIKVLCDISLRKVAEMAEADLIRAEQEKMAAERASRLKDNFISVLSHELRNPLAPMANAIRLLRHEQIAPEAKIRMLDILERQIANISRMIEDLLDVSRIEQGKVVLRKEAVNLLRLIVRAREVTFSSFADKKMTLLVHTPRELIWIDGDPVRLEQVLVNLLNNAAKYTDRGGRVTLRCYRENDEAVIRIKDTGIGIPPDMLPHIWDLFTQLTPREAHQTGLGIGLALVKNIVSLHGGSVSAQSRGLGHGSEFTVRLPIAESVVPKRQITITPSAPVSKRKILVVDDHEDSALSTAALLETMGHEVRTATSGTAAIEVAREFVPEVVLLDIGLPDLSGYQVIRRLKEEPALARTIFAAFTGYGQEEDHKKILEAGFDYHLVKPTIDFRPLEKILSEKK